MFIAGNSHRPRDEKSCKSEITRPRKAKGRLSGATPDVDQKCDHEGRGLVAAIGGEARKHHEPGRGLGSADADRVVLLGIGVVEFAAAANEGRIGRRLCAAKRRESSASNPIGKGSRRLLPASKADSLCRAPSGSGAAFPDWFRFFRATDRRIRADIGCRRHGRAPRRRRESGDG